MNQSAFILGALLAGFVLYLAMKNRLAVYTGVLWGAKPAASSPSQGSSSGGGSTASSVVDGVKTAAEVVGLFA